LQAYIGDYLREEIHAEALTRNLSAFIRFLEVSALSCDEMLKDINIASECGVSSLTVKEYFSILEATMIGFMVPSYRKTFGEEHLHSRRIVVANEPVRRISDDIIFIPVL
jgi:hypothetical protein